MQPKISIVCPIYKAEAYLRNCLDHINSQTLSSWECILVDDGSHDSSGAICDEYANKDSRFKVIHKANEGVSIARQTGLDNAIGEYVIQTDPDDWIENDMFEKMYNKAKETDADMVISDYYHDELERKLYISQNPDDFMQSGLLGSLFSGLHGSTWNKLIKLSTIKKFDIRFPEHVVYCEDTVFILRLLNKPIKIAYLGEAFYHYVQYSNPDSLVRSYSKKASDSDLCVFAILKGITEGTPAYDVFRKDYGCAIIRRAYDSRIFSSIEFMRRYRKLLGTAILVAGVNTRIRYALSCIGGYGLAVSIDKFICKIRKDE